MTELLIRLTRNVGGGSTLRCDRVDGMATWQTHRGKQASFFPMHDLVHYAVETHLGFRRGFYGLIAEGWDIRDTEGRGPRGPLPPEALNVENLVGLLFNERSCGAVWTEELFNAQMASIAVLNTRQAAFQLSEDDLFGVRSCIHDLFGRWNSTAPNGTLSLWFERQSHRKGGPVPFDGEAIDNQAGTRTV